MNNKFSDDISKLLKSIGLLALFIGVIWGVNIVVDPANIAGSGYARDVAQIMISGKNVTNIQNLDDRELIEEYVELFNEPLDVLVLGSSRSMQITPQLTGVEKTFCAGVTGADLRDSISTYLLFKEKGILPQKVIFCAEYWFLSSGNLDSRALTEKYYEFCDLTGNIPYKSDSKVKTKIKELISFSYFQSSVEFLLSGKNAALEATDQKDNTLATRRYDGSYSYDQEYREGGVEQSDKYAEESTIANLLAVYFSGIDVNLKKQTEDFIEMMIDDGVTVEIQLAPFHPIYYNHMTVTESFEEILSTEEYYHGLAEKYSIKCYGSYNPEKFGMTSIDFYDAQHPTAEGIYKYYGKLITSNSEVN